MPPPAHDRVAVASVPPNLHHMAGDFWPISASRALPYAAVGLRRADRTTRDAFEAVRRERPACVRRGGRISCVGQGDQRSIMESINPVDNLVGHTDTP